jgi:putative transposase
MPRLARVVVPGLPHHVLQRGNRRQRTFFARSDYEYYLELLREWAGKRGVSVWAYCLMPNHVHLVLVPQERESLAAAMGEVHRRYTRMINFRKHWRGFLWQGRFNSFPMDEPHLLAALRYVHLNPLRARIVEQLDDWPYSSYNAHMRGGDDLVDVYALQKHVNDWRRFLQEGISDQVLKKLRSHSRTGRPLGSKSFINKIEKLLGRRVRPGKTGRRKEDKQGGVLIERHT